jgi:hypothetical protein
MKTRKLIITDHLDGTDVKMETRGSFTRAEIIAIFEMAKYRTMIDAFKVREEK